jgi:hypothetical protein
VINEVDVAPLIDAELDRRDPDRVAMRPTDPAGFGAAWEVVERRWAATVERARRLDPDLLHESVAGEWSFIETLRHLVYATDAWVRRAVLGDPSPWHPLDLPWDEMPDTPGTPRDRQVRPSLDEVLVLRRDRMAGVRKLISELTEQSLAARTVPVDAPGWPPAESFPVSECLLVVLNEEWQHRRYAERDLAVLDRQRTTADRRRHTHTGPTAPAPPPPGGTVIVSCGPASAQLSSTVTGNASLRPPVAITLVVAARSAVIVSPGSSGRQPNHTCSRVSPATLTRWTMVGLELLPEVIT